MDYEKIYQQLIEKAKYRVLLDNYYEKHHIVPKSFGGSDELNNIVKLTAREHFIAHRLLAKIYPNSGMVHALWMMSNIKKYDKLITSHMYENIRIKHSIFISKSLIGIKRSEETIDKFKKYQNNRTQKHKDKLNNYLKNKTVDHKRNIGLAHKGILLNEDHKQNISKGVTGEKNGMFGKTHDEEAKQKIIESNKQQIECPWCCKVGGIAIMKRWHFDYCKENPNGLERPKMKRKSPTEETKEKIRQGNLGKKSLWKGKTISTDAQKEGIKKMVETRKKNGSYKMSDEQKEKLSQAHLGKKGTPCSKERKKQLSKEKSKKIKCPHCGKEGQCMVMKRWHFDKCKQKEIKNE